MIQQNPSTLIVGESPSMREYIVAVLENAGYSTVYEAKNGLEALKVLERHSISVVIANELAGSGSRNTVVNEIRKKTTNQHIPVLMLTSEWSKGDDENLPYPGPTWYVLKPFTPSGLLERFVGALPH